MNENQLTRSTIAPDDVSKLEVLKAGLEPAPAQVVTTGNKDTPTTRGARSVENRKAQQERELTAMVKGLSLGEARAERDMITVFLDAVFTARNTVRDEAGLKPGDNVDKAQWFAAVKPLLEGIGMDTTKLSAGRFFAEIAEAMILQRILSERINELNPPREPKKQKQAAWVATVPKRPSDKGPKKVSSPRDGRMPQAVLDRREAASRLDDPEAYGGVIEGDVIARQRELRKQERARARRAATLGPAEANNAQPQEHTPEQTQVPRKLLIESDLEFWTIYKRLEDNYRAKHANDADLEATLARLKRETATRRRAMKVAAGIAIAASTNNLQ